MTSKLSELNPTDLFAATESDEILLEVKYDKRKKEWIQKKEMEQRKKMTITSITSTLRAETRRNGRVEEPSKEGKEGEEGGADEQEANHVARGEDMRIGMDVGMEGSHVSSSPKKRRVWLREQKEKKKADRCMNGSDRDDEEEVDEVVGKKGGGGEGEGSDIEGENNDNESINQKAGYGYGDLSQGGKGNLRNREDMPHMKYLFVRYPIGVVSHKDSIYGCDMKGKSALTV